MKVAWDANFEKFRDLTAFKPSVLYFFRTWTEYDYNLKERYIHKRRASSNKVPNVCKDVNKSNYLSSVKILKNQNILYLKNGDVNYWLQNIPDGESFVLFDVDFAKELLKRYDSRTLMIFVWFCRKWDQRKNINFTFQDIGKNVFGKQYWNTGLNNRIKKSVEQLAEDGLIGYKILKFGDELSFTYIKQLTFVASSIGKE